MDKWIRVAALRVSASDIASAIHRADGGSDDSVVVAFHTQTRSTSVRAGHSAGRRLRGHDSGVHLCVMQRAQALALVASITSEEQSGQRLLDVAPPGLIPVLVIGDYGVSVGVYDPRRPDGGWE
jgi:hypothetical protein